MSERFDVNKKYDPVGKCIYCGSETDLSDEHIIPYGLGGRAVLPQSSCKPCARITGKIEGQILRGPMQQMRVALNVQSRSHHKDAPKTRKYEIERSEGIPERLELNLIDSPVQLICPIFELPGFLAPEGYTEGIRLSGYALRTFGRNLFDVAVEQNAKAMSWVEPFPAISFARMIAKIAFSSACAHTWDDGHQLPFYERSFVLSSILGDAADVGKWVENHPDPPKRDDGQLHNITFTATNDRQFVVAEVQLFAEPNSPCYVAVLGKMPHQE